MLYLTDGGRRRLDATDPAAQRVDDLLLAVLSTAEREPFLAALQAIVRNLQAAK